MGTGAPARLLVLHCPCIIQRPSLSLEHPLSLVNKQTRAPPPQASKRCFLLTTAPAGNFHLGTPPPKQKNHPRGPEGCWGRVPERSRDLPEATGCQQWCQDSPSWVPVKAGAVGLLLGAPPALGRAELGTSPERERKTSPPGTYTGSRHPVPQLCPPRAHQPRDLAGARRAWSGAQSCRRPTSRGAG